MSHPGHRSYSKRLAFQRLEDRRLLVATVDAGHHVVIPDAANQAVPVEIQDAEQLNGINLRVQLGDGSGPNREPGFTGFEVDRSFWAVANPDDLHWFGGPIDPAGPLLQGGVVTNTRLMASGIAVRLIIDTSGIDAGRFDLLLQDTEIGADTDLAGDVARLLDGSISIARPGDATLDGAFTSADLVEVFIAGKYEDAIPGNATWTEGDWDGDGDFTSSDLVFALQRNAYESPAAATPAQARVAAAVDALMRDNDDKKRSTTI